MTTPGAPPNWEVAIQTLQSAISLAMVWDPELKGCVLDPCQLITDLVENSIRPDLHDGSDSDWTLQAISSELDRAPGVKEEIFETIVALWRLRQVHEGGPYEASWQDHMEAWLVRCENCGYVE